MAGLGAFAGGLATGYVTGRRNARDEERARREEEEFQYQQGERTRKQNAQREYGNAYGSVGTEREDGSIYTQENADQDAFRNVARYDQEMAQRVQSSGLQRKAAELAIGKGVREKKYADNEDAWMEFQQQYGQLPNEEYFPAAAKFASQRIPDGKTFGVTFDPNAGWRVVVTDTKTGQVSFKGIPGRQQFDGALQRYLSPAMMRHADTMDLKSRELGQKDTELGLRSRLIDAQSTALRSLARQRDGVSGMKLSDGDKIVLTSLQRQEQALTTALGKAESPEQMAQLRQQHMGVRRQLWDIMGKNKMIPAGTTKTQFLGLPDPLEVARQAMTNARDEKTMRASIEQFRSLYGDAPEAAEAENALNVFMQQKFYNKVRPQNDTSWNVGMRPASAFNYIGMRAREHAVPSEEDAQLTAPEVRRQLPGGLVPWGFRGGM